MAVRRSLTASVPGKVLIVGGFLILEKSNQGLVVAVDARINARVTVEYAEEPSERISVSFTTPQFSMEPAIKVDFNKRTRRIEGECPNSFVLFSIEGCLSELDVGLIQNIEIAVTADSRFYSSINDTLAATRKTGLGSSAALVASITAALIACIDLKLSKLDDDFKRRIFRIAQSSHSKAQGKIGSGFDVSAAIYGTQIYERFSAESLSSGVLDQCITQLKIPLLKLMLGDVNRGSKTPSAVSQVLQWKNSASQDIWMRLASLNSRFISLLVVFDGSVEAVAEMNRCFLEIRKALKMMGTESNTEIEPDVLTGVLDSTMALPGVVAAGVPGAGGFDALFCLAVSQDALNLVDSHWRSYSGIPIVPISVKEDEGLLIEFIA